MRFLRRRITHAVLPKEGGAGGIVDGGRNVGTHLTSANRMCSSSPQWSSRCHTPAIGHPASGDYAALSPYWDSAARIKISLRARSPIEYRRNLGLARKPAQVFCHPPDLSFGSTPTASWAVMKQRIQMTPKSWFTSGSNSKKSSAPLASRSSAIQGSGRSRRPQ